METVIVDNIASGDTSLSLLALFWQADLVVKSVILVLLCASVWCWAIIFEKWILLKKVRFNIRQFEDGFFSGESLEQLYLRVKDKPLNPITAIFVAGMKELKGSMALSAGKDNFTLNSYERIERIMKSSLDKEVGKLETRITFLASVGSTAPFIGLFGTVWGIMNSFHAIGLSGNTSLAVVAPGIAEALFATALGLVAAIPAVLTYNKFSRDIDKIAFKLENFADEFSAIISRQLEIKMLKS